MSLKSINDAFSSALEEEQAFALCFQAALCGKQVLESGGHCRAIRNCDNIIIETNGTVHPHTFEASEEYKRAVVSSQKELIEQLGRVVYQALDYGLGDDVERNLSPSLQSLIERMAIPDELEYDTDDEGIGVEPSDNTPINTLDEVLEVCSEHAGGPIVASSHYRMVCRALVTEATELGVFLDQVNKSTSLIRTGNEPEQAMEVYVNIWARVWMHVVKELRQGVKLKSSFHACQEPKQVSYALTPYEMLMDDIRSKRYSLQKVLPVKVQKDAHGVVMEFIRKRPPLTPASNRQLKPKPACPLTPWEIVHRQIKAGSFHLNRVITVESPTIVTEFTERGEAENKIVEVTDDAPGTEISINTSCPVAVPRRLIPADSSLSSLPNLEKENEEGGSPDSSCNNSPVGSLETQLVSYQTDALHGVDRRHSISVMDRNNLADMPVDHAHTAMSLSPAINKGPALMDMAMYHKPEQYSYQDSLTMEEMVVIRKEMVRAELDTLRRKPNITKGKVCFGCRETRFRWYKSNRHKCRLCDQLLCSNCVTTVLLPEEQLGNVAVASLILPDGGAKDQRALFAAASLPPNANRAAMYGVLVTVCLECVSFLRLVLQKTAKSRQNFNQALQPEFKLNITFNLSVS